jgi:hypothetical protein
MCLPDASCWLASTASTAPAPCNPAKPAMDLQLILAGLEGAKELIQGAMSEIKKS